MKKTKTQLFLELAKPDGQGISRWVNTNEFLNEYSVLQLGNGGSWCRAESQLAKRHIVEFDKSKTKGNSIDAIRLNGLCTDIKFNQNIRADIKNRLKNQKCVMLGVNGSSANVVIEIDHKDGRKQDNRVGEVGLQKTEDFQPLCKAANTIKRQICKRCKETNIRWDAKNLKGNPYSFYEGDKEYCEDLGCKGCYQFDPVEYRKQSVRKISEEATKHTADFIFSKLYPGEEVE